MKQRYVRSNSQRDGTYHYVEDTRLQDIADAYETWQNAVATPIDVDHVGETCAAFFALLDALLEGTDDE